MSAEQEPMGFEGEPNSSVALVSAEPEDGEGRPFMLCNGGEGLPDPPSHNRGLFQARVAAIAGGTVGYLGESGDHSLYNPRAIIVNGGKK